MLSGRNVTFTTVVDYIACQCTQHPLCGEKGVKMRHKRDESKERDQIYKKKQKQRLDSKWECISIIILRKSTMK